MSSTSSRLAEMREKREEAVVGFRKFLLLYPECKGRPVCFVEGEDAKYYSIRIKQNCDNTTPVFIVCNGKKGVIEAIEKIKDLQKYQDLKLFAFVDSDFDDAINKPYIYETPCYSIENFYTSHVALSEILFHEFKLDPIDDMDDFSLCMKLYVARQQEFHDAISLLNAWIACQTQNGAVSSQLNLKNNDKKVMKNFIDIRLDQVTKNYEYDTIIDTFSHAEIIPLEEVLKMEGELMLDTPQKVYRGKYEIEFLRIFIEKLKLEFVKDLNLVSNKKKVDLLLTPTNIISQLSQYADTPNCLIDYLSRVWDGERAMTQ